MKLKMAPTAFHGKGSYVLVTFKEPVRIDWPTASEDVIAHVETRAARVTAMLAENLGVRGVPPMARFHVTHVYLHPDDASHDPTSQWHRVWAVAPAKLSVTLDNILAAKEIKQAPLKAEIEVALELAHLPDPDTPTPSDDSAPTAREVARQEEVGRDAEEARRDAEEARRDADEARRDADEARRDAERARRDRSGVYECYVLGRLGGATITGLQDVRECGEPPWTMTKAKNECWAVLAQSRGPDYDTARRNAIANYRELMPAVFVQFPLEA